MERNQGKLVRETDAQRLACKLIGTHEYEEDKSIIYGLSIAICKRCGRIGAIKKATSGTKVQTRGT